SEGSRPRPGAPAGAGTCTGAGEGREAGVAGDRGGGGGWAGAARRDDRLRREAGGSEHGGVPPLPEVAGGERAAAGVEEVAGIAVGQRPPPNLPHAADGAGEEPAGPSPDRSAGRGRLGGGRWPTAIPARAILATPATASSSAPARPPR